MAKKNTIGIPANFEKQQTDTLLKKRAHTTHEHLMFSSIAFIPVTTNFTDGIMINTDCLDVLTKINDKSVSAIIINPQPVEPRRTARTAGVSPGPPSSGCRLSRSFRVLTKGGHMVVFASGKTIFDIHMSIASAFGVHVGTFLLLIEKSQSSLSLQSGLTILYCTLSCD